jgi:hypothetical protein
MRFFEVLAVSLGLDTRGHRLQFFTGNFDNLAIAPDHDWSPLARMFDNHLLHAGLERHFGPLHQRQFENVCGWLCHVLP